MPSKSGFVSTKFFAVVLFALAGVATAEQGKSIEQADISKLAGQAVKIMDVSEITMQAIYATIEGMPKQMAETMISQGAPVELFDNGNFFPEKKSFINTSFDPTTKTFIGELDFSSASVGGETLWKYRMVFSSGYQQIINGEINTFNENGDKIHTVYFDKNSWFYIAKD